MYKLLHQRLRHLQNAAATDVLRQGLIGIEREALRITHNGNIAHTPHPVALGAALTHPYITTDYSEALIELITPPGAEKSAIIKALTETHSFVHEHLHDEYLWAASMPALLNGDESVPIAIYGKSNAGTMKTVYRRGLGLRYGRTMQAIAGVHFNYSMAAEYWPIMQELEAKQFSIMEYTANSYMDAIRNIQRYGWLIPYLFGASPVICQSFIKQRPKNLKPFTPNTLYYPYATSLRMGDIGYQNSLEEGKGFRANYDSLDSYLRSLIWATGTPCPDYARIGIIAANGEYQQLNDNVLQIENEHYSTIRPKQILNWLEKPSLALRRRGIRYLELRSLDVNIFEPIGLNLEQLYFLEMFVLLCLWQSSPHLFTTESKEINANQILVAHRGREPNLYLSRNSIRLFMREWAHELLEEMLPIAEILDANEKNRPYNQALIIAKERITYPDSTPSALMLATMADNNMSFLDFALSLSQKHQANLKTTYSLSEKRRAYFIELARISHQQQRELEITDHTSFTEFLTGYFNQS